MKRLLAFFCGAVVTWQTSAETVQINEVLAHGVTALGGAFDGVEICNTNNVALDLSDHSLSDSAVNKRKYVFPAGSVIPAHGFLTVVLEPANTNNNFGLKGSGDDVYLFTPGGAELDHVVFGLQTPDLSIGRVPDGSANWVLTSPTFGSANNAAPLASPGALRINEWMAFPKAGDEDYFELFNTSTNPVALGGLVLKDNSVVETVISALSFIGVGVNGFMVFTADDDTGAGADHVGFRLGQGGDSIILSNATGGTIIDAVTFGAQEQGVSEGRLPDGAVTIPFRRFAEHPTPGAPNFGLITNIVVNELLTHTDPPLEDAIELHNLTEAAVDISGWWLSDRFDDLKRFQVPAGTVIAAHGYKVFYQYQFDTGPKAFAFNSAHGGSVFLTQPDAGGVLVNYLEQKFEPSENGVSFGRIVTSDGKDHLAALACRSFGRDYGLPSGNAGLPVFRQGTGLTNACGPKLGPVIINEIMFQPPDVITPGATNDNSIDEFVELRNITGNSVPLFDPNALTNWWKVRNGVSYDFPSNTVMAPSGFILLVNFDPVTNLLQAAAFRAKYGVAETVPLFGPYSGKLDNNGEPIELLKPDPPQLAPHLDEGFVPYILVDKVRYNDAAPWPTNAAGTGRSLQRHLNPAFGREPTNWFSGNPTAGRLNAEILSITSQPQSQPVLAGQNTVLTVGVEGTAPGFQWYKNGRKIRGATAASLTLSNASRLRTAGNYSVLVTNVAGNLMSSNAVVSVITPVRFTIHPASRTVSQGRTAIFSARATGTTPLAYQWWFNGNAVLNATNSRLTITNCQPALHAGAYAVTASNLLSGAVSRTVTLTVRTNSP